MKNKLFYILLTLLFTANTGICKDAGTAAIQSPIMKFVYAMTGVIVSAAIIFAGLLVYNKLLRKSSTHTPEEDILKTPKTKDEAIRFFIIKNKL